MSSETKQSGGKLGDRRFYATENNELVCMECAPESVHADRDAFLKHTCAKSKAPKAKGE